MLRFLSLITARSFAPLRCIPILAFVVAATLVLAGCSDHIAAPDLDEPDAPSVEISTTYHVVEHEPWPVDQNALTQAIAARDAIVPVSRTTGRSKSTAINVTLGWANEMTCSDRVDFQTLGGVVRNYPRQSMAFSGVQVAERFAGQSIGTARYLTYDHEVLTGTPTGPLQLRYPGKGAENFSSYQRPDGDISVGGNGSNGIYEPAIGSVALLFEDDQNEMSLHIVGTEPGGEITFEFFQRDGTRIHTETIASEKGATVVSFRRVDETVDIAGVSMYNVDPGGVRIDWVRYCEGGPAVDEPVLSGERQIFSDVYDQTYPDIDGNIIVWWTHGSIRHPSSTSIIQAHDLSTGVTKQISPHSEHQLYPAVSDGVVVWTDKRKGNGDIYAYDMKTDVATQITDDTWGQQGPAVSGDVIVWSDDRHGNTDIYMYDLSTGAETQITDNAGGQYQPAISGDVIVWMDRRHGNADIYMYNLSTGVETQITTSTAAQFNAAIDGDIIVWKDERNGNGDIYAYDISTGVETQITTSTAGQNEPDISGNIIVWREWTGSHRDVFAYDLSTGRKVRITDAASDQFNPAVSGNVIVWQDARDDSYGIHAYGL